MTRKYVFDVPKTLPIIFLIDYKKTDDFDKFEKTLKDSVLKMVEDLKKLKLDKFKIDFYFIPYGGNVGLISNLKIVNDNLEYKINIVSIKTFDDALIQAKMILENKNCWPSNSYWPTIVLIFKEMNIDEYKECILSLRKSCLYLKYYCINFNFKIKDYKTNYNKDIANQMFYTSYEEFHKFFDSITSMIELRLKSDNPNDIPK